MVPDEFEQGERGLAVPIEQWGERVHAIVQASPAPSEEALRAHLAEHLVRYKIPRTFEFVDTPLRDEAGKLRRSALRDARTPPKG